MIKFTRYCLLSLMLAIPKIAIGIQYNAENPALTDILTAGVVQSDADGDLYSSTTIATPITISNINAATGSFGTLNVTGSATVGGPLGVAGAAYILGAMNVTGAVNFGNNLHVQGTLGVSGAATFDSLVTENNGVKITAGGLNVTGSAQFNGAANVQGALGVSGSANVDGFGTFGTGVHVQGALGVSGAANVDNVLTAATGVNVGGALGVSGAGTVDGFGIFGTGVHVQGALGVSGAATVDGNESVGGVLALSGGTGGAPSLTFTGDTTTGIYRQSAGKMAFAVSPLGDQMTISNGLVDVGALTTLHAGGALGVSGAANVDGVGTFGTDVHVQSALGVSGAANVDGVGTFGTDVHVQGALGVSGATTVTGNTATNPAIRFGASYPNTGIYSNGSDIINFGASGAEAFYTSFTKTHFDSLVEAATGLNVGGALGVSGAATFGGDVAFNSTVNGIIPNPGFVVPGTLLFDLFSVENSIYFTGGNPGAPANTVQFFESSPVVNGKIVLITNMASTGLGLSSLGITMPSFNLSIGESAILFRINGTWKVIKSAVLP